VNDLGAFMRRSFAQRFVWGECDCGLWASSWVKEKTGRDPAAPVRGRYKTKLGYIRYFARLGGLVGHFCEIMTREGFRPTEDPKPGDVAIIETPEGPAVVIRTELGWAWKSEKGIAVVQRSVPFLVAFAV
jgi:hypothetical protein